jgi:hypothetical protein
VNTASVGPDNAAIAKLQDGLKKAGLYDGPVNGAWDSQTNHAYATLIIKTQIEGLVKKDGSYEGKIDGLYGPHTKTALERSGADPALVKTLDSLRAQGKLRDLYQPEDINRITSEILQAKTETKDAPRTGTSAAKSIQENSRRHRKTTI